jgi:hypothetical protein
MMKTGIATETSEFYSLQRRAIVKLSLREDLTDLQYDDGHNNFCWYRGLNGNATVEKLPNTFLFL